MIDRVHHFIRFHYFITSCFINISMQSKLLTAGPFFTYITVGYKPLCKYSMLVNVTKIQMSIGIGSSKHPQELLGAVHFQCLWRPAASVPSMWSTELNASSTPIRAMWISWGQLISVKRGNTIDTYCHIYGGKTFQASGKLGVMRVAHGNLGALPLILGRLHFCSIQFGLPPQTTGMAITTRQ